MFNSAQNRALVQTEIDELFIAKFNGEQFPGHVGAEFAPLFQVVNTELDTHFISLFKGANLPQQIGETQSVPRSTPKTQFTKTVTVKDFADSVELSKNLFDDGKFDVIQDTVSDMAVKARIGRDRNAFRPFRNGFTTELTADGVSWFNNSHTLISGGTEDNLVTGALSDSTLNTAIVRLLELKDQAGVIRGSVPSLLVVAPANFKNAVQVTGSELISGSANNDTNMFFKSMMGLQVVTSQWLGAAAGGSDTAWFLLGSNHGLRRLVRQDVQTAMRGWEQSDNRTILYQYNFREEVYVADFCGAVGSTGL